MHPFPVEAARNYNAIGCGFNVVTGDYVSKWHVPTRAKQFPDERDIQVVIDHMERIYAQRDHPHWCSGVAVLLVYLKAMKARWQ